MLKNLIYISTDLKKKLIKEKHKVQKLYIKFPVTYGERYRQIRNQVNSAVSRAKSAYYRNKLEVNQCNKPRGTWNLINKILGRHKAQSRISNKFQMDGKIIDDPNEIANRFINYIASIGTKLASKFAINDDYVKCMPTVNSRFKFRLISNSEMKSIINKLRNASPGHDFLPMSLFKDNIDHLIDVITYICNLILSKGIFPDDLMLAVVTCLVTIDPCLFCLPSIKF